MTAERHRDDTADHGLEERFVKTFIRKGRQERLLHELTSPAKRYAGISRFCHQAEDLLNRDRISMMGEDLDRRPEFRRFVEEHESDCYILSPDPWLNEEMLPFTEAVEKALMCPDAAVIVGETFAVVFGEPMKGGRGKYLLKK